ncbi:cob(I)yrinic acid a,c-diamide adenosyltransferase [Galbibacter sp.]|uniref:cob(I)yrinic acid a,c-diamide adenosyltransferase n=1 Tax=Galbibacter sp. TaxID=2918471 RepID=UPI003A92724F
MKIYTKTGDKGSTSLFGGNRVAKHHIRIDAYGTTDELNSWLGLIRDQNIDQRYKSNLIKIQEHLFTLGSILATPKEKLFLKNGKKRLNIQWIEQQHIEFLEHDIDLMDQGLPPMTHFVLPGGHTTVSYCHIARTVCRRAERNVSHLNENEAIDPFVLQYLNRLSDYLFVLARKLSFELEADQILWAPDKER